MFERRQASHNRDFQLGSFPLGWTYAYRPSTASDGSNFSLSDWTEFSVDNGTVWYGPNQFSTPWMSPTACHPGELASTASVISSYALPFSGDYRIEANWQRSSTGGDGVQVFLFHELAMLFTEVLLGSATHTSQLISASAGERISLVVDRRGNYSSDQTSMLQLDIFRRLASPVKTLLQARSTQRMELRL
ncbi:hypothetical protein SH139x_002771 [Planctomycetaceae bacterium SH139]